MWTSALNGSGILSYEEQKELQCPANKAAAYDPKTVPSKYVYAALAGYHSSRQSGLSRHPLAALNRPSQVAILADAAEMDWPKPRVNYRFNRQNWEETVGFDVHPGGAHILFGDGHIETVKDKEAFKTEWVEDAAVLNR